MSTPSNPSLPRSRRRRRLAETTASILLGATALSGCGGDASGNEAAMREDGSVDLSRVTLVVGDQKGGSQALLRAAGLLDDVEYDLEWREFTSGPPLLEAMNAEAIHVGGVGNTPPLFAAAGGSEFEVVQAATYGGLGDAILVPADSEISSVADLDGLSVAVAVGSSANYNLLAQLEAAGLEYDDVEITNLQPADALAAFDAGHIDAWAIWEPFTSQAEQDADARVLADGTTLMNGYTFQVASRAALEDPATQAALQDYLARIAEAQSWSATHKEQWATVWAEETGLDPQVTLAAVRKREVEVVPVDETLVASEQVMADGFAEAGLIPDAIEVDDWFSGDFNDHVLAHGASR